MKNNRKKGFTIVELVIVIAVIAILAAVLIPTFSNVIKKANESAVQQTAAALYREALALDLADGTQDGKEGNTAITTVEGKTVTYTVTTSGDAVTVSFSYTDTAKKLTATYNGTAWTVGTAGSEGNAG